MPEHPYFRRCVPALGPVLFVCLLLALPGAAFAAAGGGGTSSGSSAAGEGSSSAAAEERGAPEDEESARERTESEAGEGGTPPKDGSTTGTSSDGGAEPAPGAPPGAADAERDRPTARTAPARPSRALRKRGARLALGTRLRPAVKRPSLGHLDGLGDAIRRKTRARAEGTRRRLQRAAERLRADLRGERRDDDRRAEALEDAEKDAIRVSVASEERIELYPGSHHIRVGRRVLVQGYEPPRRAGRRVVLEVLSGGRWVAVDVATTVEGGKFELEWTPRRPGRYQARVRPYSSRSTVEPSGVRRLFVYRTAVASWYGPGFYGNRTACGQTFTSRLMGVAHKTLPCGYLVRIRYNGRSSTVPVVDRGPFVDGRDYDLTEALRNYLRFNGVQQVLATA